MNKISILFLASTLLLILSCQPDQKEGAAIDAISLNAPLIIQFHDLEQTADLFAQSEFLSQSLNLDKLSRLKKMVDEVSATTGMEFRSFRGETYGFLSEAGAGKYDWVLCTSSKFIKSYKGLSFGGEWSVERRSYSSSEILTVSDGAFTFYALEMNGILAVSLNENLVEEVIRQLESELTLRSNADFNRHLDIATHSDPLTLFVNLKKTSPLFKKLLPLSSPDWIDRFGTWAELDLMQSGNALVLNGASMNSDSSQTYLRSFHNVGVAKIEAPEIVPSGAVAAIFQGSDNFMVYHRNYDDFLRANGLFRNVSRKREALGIDLDVKFYRYIDDEFGVIYTESKSSVARGKMAYIKLKKADEGFRQFMAFSDEMTENYREHPIYQINLDQLLPAAMGRTFKGMNTPYFTLHGEWVVFVNDKVILKSVINDWISGKTWSNSSGFQNLAGQFSGSANIWAVLKNPGAFDLACQFLDEDGLKLTGNNKDLYTQPDWLSLQIKTKRDASLVSAYLGKQEEASRDASQVWTLQLEGPVIGEPQFIFNHQSGQRDLLVQDEANNLYQIDPKGAIRWKLALDAPMVGKATQVDLFRNNKYQLAFVAGNKLYIVDRLGRVVDPFPVQMEGSATAPLAVFDYDRSRNYRFLVACGNKVYNYNKEGVIVKGWKFKKSNSEIRVQPKHYVIGGKDYIVVGETNGKVHVLNRKGEPRIKLKQKMHFNETIYLQKGQTLNDTRLLSINSQGYLKSLFFSDRTDSVDLDLEEVPEFFRFDGTYMLFGGGSYLSVREQTHPFSKELDHVISLPPVMKKIDNMVYFACSTGDQVFLFDANGETIPGFPVYGSSIPAVGRFTNNGNTHLAAGSSDGMLYLYRVME